MRAIWFNVGLLGVIPGLYRGNIKVGFRALSLHMVQFRVPRVILFGQDHGDPGRTRHTAFASASKLWWRHEEVGSHPRHAHTHTHKKKKKN